MWRRWLMWRKFMELKDFLLFYFRNIFSIIQFETRLLLTDQPYFLYDFSIRYQPFWCIHAYRYSFVRVWFVDCTTAFLGFASYYHSFRKFQTTLYSSTYCVAIIHTIKKCYFLDRQMNISVLFGNFAFL